MDKKTSSNWQIEELERLAALDLPVWSKELTDQADPVLRSLEEQLNQEPEALTAVLDYLECPRSEVVADWLRLQLHPDLSLDDESPRELSYGANTVPVQPALFLAIDEVSVPAKKLCKLKKPWEHAAGWFFGLPQKSPGIDVWPVGADGDALDFIVQVNLAASSSRVGHFGALGLPGDLTLQIFADLDVTRGAMDHHVVAFPSTTGGDGVVRPPRRSNVNDADPVLVNPVGALTLPPESALGDVEEGRLRSLLLTYAHRAPYDLNLFKHTSENDSQHGEYVPMARMGGFPVADPSLWKTEAESALGCSVEEMTVVYDGPTEPEPRQVADPERVRLMILMERARLSATNFEATFAFGY